MQMKERRLAPAGSNNGSIKLPSPAPANQYTPSQRSRLSQQAHRRNNSPATRSRRATSLFGPDEDAEGEDDLEENGEDGGDPEDQRIYCFCQKLSYGEVSNRIS
jgi:hypothetical protein